MCERYFLAQDGAGGPLDPYLAQAAARAARMRVPLRLSGEIRPTDVAPVIATSAVRRAVGAFPMRWGFLHPTHGVLVFTTRCETAAEKPLFCTSLADRRCLIPAAGFFEWRTADGQKTKFAFSAETGEPLYLAGLYLRSSHEKLPFFTILTREAPAGAKAARARLPVVLPISRLQDWLSPEKDFSEFLFDAPPALAQEAC